MSTKDAVCNGQGWIWRTPYFEITCWRCAGTGTVPELVPPKEKGPISPLAEGDDDEGGGEGRPKV